MPVLRDRYLNVAEMRDMNEFIRESVNLNLLKHLRAGEIEKLLAVMPIICFAESESAAHDFLLDFLQDESIGFREWSANEESNMQIQQDKMQW